MGKRKEYVAGEKIGECFFVAEAGYSRTGMRRMLFRCVCGNEFVAMMTNVRFGEIKSCGCYRKKMLTKHGMHESPEYDTWSSMKDRCYNPKRHRFYDYGGRGIKMSDSWRSDFVNFFQDMGLRPSGRHTLERIDNDGDYCKENCRWATYKEQFRNRRGNVFIEYKGRKLIVGDWAKETGIGRDVLTHRLRRGWPVEEIFHGQNPSRTRDENGKFAIEN